MNTISIISILTLSLLSSTTMAAGMDHDHHGDHAHDHAGQVAEKTVPGTADAACDNIVDVQVNGMVCDFCARALEKVMGRRDEVAGIDVDLDKSMVVVAMNSGMTIDDSTMTALITDSGYDVVSIAKRCE